MELEGIKEFYCTIKGSCNKPNVFDVLDLCDAIVIPPFSSVVDSFLIVFFISSFSRHFIIFFYARLPGLAFSTTCLKTSFSRCCSTYTTFLPWNLPVPCLRTWTLLNSIFRHSIFILHPRNLKSKSLNCLPSVALKTSHAKLPFFYDLIDPIKWFYLEIDQLPTKFDRAFLISNFRVDVIP